MKKAEVGRFSISPDEDSSSYSSNSDFNYSYPTKQAALKRWEKFRPFFKGGFCFCFLSYCSTWRMISERVSGCLIAMTVSGVKGDRYLKLKHLSEGV